MRLATLRSPRSAPPKTLTSVKNMLPDACPQRMQAWTYHVRLYCWRADSSSPQYPRISYLPTMTEARTDRWRTNADPDEVARKLSLLEEPHIAPLTAYVRRLGERRDGDGDDSIPWFDPTEAGVGARILMLFEAPGRRATEA
jgi:hypothetical protein